MNEVVERQRFGLNGPQKRVAEEVRVATLAPAERDLIEIGGKMFDADLVARAEDRAVEEAANAFYGVGVNLRVHPLVAGVIDGLVPRVGVADADVGAMFVGVGGLGFVGDHVAQELVNRLASGIRCNAQPELASALYSAEHDGLTGAPVAAPGSFVR